MIDYIDDFFFHNYERRPDILDKITAPLNYNHPCITLILIVV